MRRRDGQPSRIAKWWYTHEKLSLLLNGSFVLSGPLTHKAAAQSLCHAETSPAGPPTHPSPPVHGRAANGRVRDNNLQGQEAVSICRGYGCEPDPTHLLQHTVQVWVTISSIIPAKLIIYCTITCHYKRLDKVTLQARFSYTLLLRGSYCSSCTIHAQITGDLTPEPFSSRWSTCLRAWFHGVDELSRLHPPCSAKDQLCESTRNRNLQPPALPGGWCSQPGGLKHIWVNNRAFWCSGAWLNNVLVF